MRANMVRSRRLCAHRLTAPARSITDAADALLAVQSQEFWGGRWALAARTRGEPTLAEVDQAFERGELVRSWTQRGTLHIVPAADFLWMLSVTAPRQHATAATRRRDLGLSADVLDRGAAEILRALDGEGRLTRAEVFAVMEKAGIDPAAQRGNHLLQFLAIEGLICQGPVVARAGEVGREQYFVAVDDRMRASSHTPDDPLGELFIRYLDGHGPATPADFAWWAGLTLGMAREAAALAADRVSRFDDDWYEAIAIPPSQRNAPRVIALPSFDEYYISYSDRSLACAAEHSGIVGPTKNGLVRPVIIADGVVVGVWRHSLAVGQAKNAPEVEPLAAVDPDDVANALARYHRFVNQ